MSHELETVRPASIDELGAAVREAAGTGRAVYPFGGRTMFDYGLPPVRPGVGIDLRGLDQVIDYPARDMTITVQAGITVAGLQAILQTENQQLPIDVPAADRATLGGILATNISGPRRLGYGTLRDYVLGISVVNDEGKETKAGGYDLCKLYVGSLGTLGIIAQATLKLKPRPEAMALVVVGLSGESSIPGLLDQLHASRTRPILVELLNPATARALNQLLDRKLLAEGWSVIVGYEGYSEAVQWQTEQCLRDLPAECQADAHVATPTEAAAIRQAVTEYPLWPGMALTFKANLLPSATAAFCRQASELSEGLFLQAHAGNGIVVGQFAGESELGRVSEIVNTLRASAVAAQGNLVILRCPAEWKQSLLVWGAPRGDRWLMKRAKEQLDPRGLFNPGRFAC
jgi:glycolate oxidase FAD binding subunit